MQMDWQSPGTTMSLKRFRVMDWKSHSNLKHFSLSLGDNKTSMRLDII